MTSNDRTFTHPDVFTTGIRDGWADPETDPTRIDWTERQTHAAIPFQIIDGRPVNPCASTGIRYGRNELGHWGEALAADALVTATDHTGRWILMIERADGLGCALPGGFVDPGEFPADTAIRELAEETGIRLTNAVWQHDEPRYVPDPRASDEAWMVTVLARTDLGVFDNSAQFPQPTGADDATTAYWVPAHTYEELVDVLDSAYNQQVFPAHQQMLADALGHEITEPPRFDYLCAYAHYTGGTLAISTEHRDFNHPITPLDVSDLIDQLRERGFTAATVISFSHYETS